MKMGLTQRKTKILNFIKPVCAQLMNKNCLALGDSTGTSNVDFHIGKTTYYIVQTTFFPDKNYDIRYKSAQKNGLVSPNFFE